MRLLSGSESTQALCPACRHSHTEIADRLFALMKKLFETDSAARVSGVGCPSDMMAKLEEVFAACDEEFALEYNWANWNIQDWLYQMCPTEESLWDNTKLERISFDNVFR